jgi:hypothetical protein
MKTSLTYGFLMALGGALVTLAIFFAGLHDKPESMDAAQWIAMCLGLPVAIACLYFALRDSRERAGVAGNDWLFGSAFGLAVATVAFAAVFNAVFGYVYFAQLNPDFGSIVRQAQLAKMEATGVPAAQIDGAAKMMERFTSPAVLTISSTVGGFFGGMILAAHLALTMIRRHSRASLLKFYAVFGIVLGPLIGVSQGAAHQHTLLGLGLGCILGPLVEVGIAATVFAIVKYQPVAPPDLAAALEANPPPMLG